MSEQDVIVCAAYAWMASVEYRESRYRTLTRFMEPLSVVSWIERNVDISDEFAMNVEGRQTSKCTGIHRSRSTSTPIAMLQAR